MLSAQKGLNEPRYPTLKGIMGAKKKEIKDVKAADLGLARRAARSSSVVEARGAARRARRAASSRASAKDAVKELVRALREDAKAI